jgi:hypothetical protein
VITAEELAELLRETSKAHGRYEQEELGGQRDDDWPTWYAQYLVERLREREERDR